MYKRGQVTIFIIIAIIIVSAIVTFFVIRGGVLPQIGGQTEKNPTAFMQSCIEPKLREGIKTISLDGGYINDPLNISFKFDEDSFVTNVSYLCYSQNDFNLCVNQAPMLMAHIKNELHDYIAGDMENCFNNLKSSLESGGYTVNTNYRGFDVELNNGKVIIPLDADITLTKSGQTTTDENMSMVFLSKLDEIIETVQIIVNSEAVIGQFSPTQIMLYPDMDINKYTTADSSIIYSVTDKESKEEFRFAVRNMAIRPGWFAV